MAFRNVDFSGRGFVYEAKRNIHRLALMCKILSEIAVLQARSAKRKRFEWFKAKAPRSKPGKNN